MNKDSLIFIKFGEKEHLKKLQKGYVHMGNRVLYENFTVEDHNVNKKGIKNEDESTLFKIGNNFKLRDNPNTRYIPVFCLCQFEAKKISVNRFKLKFINEQIEKIPKSFGDYALVMNKNIFIDNFIKNAEARQLILKHRKVDYSNSIFLKSPIEECLNSTALKSGEIITGPIDREFLDSSFFEHPKKHEYQNEYRFILRNMESKDYFDFKIDPVYEYSKLFKAKDLLNDGIIEL